MFQINKYYEFKDKEIQVKFMHLWNQNYIIDDAIQEFMKSKLHN